MQKLVSQEELVELTGSKRTEKQIAVLIKHSIKFVTRTDGKIRTTWEAVNAVLAQQAKVAEDEPDLDFLRQ